MNTSGNDGKYHPVIFLRQSIPQTKKSLAIFKTVIYKHRGQGYVGMYGTSVNMACGGSQRGYSFEGGSNKGPFFSGAGSKKGTSHKHPLNRNRKCLKVSNLVPTMKLWANFRTVADKIRSMKWIYHEVFIRTNFEKVFEKVIAICDRASTHITPTLRTPCTFQLQDCNPFNVMCLVLLAKVWS